jgi:hypothetical protein
MSAVIQIRRDNAATWASINPTLAIGELGIEIDTGKLKCGNGISAWIDLGYLVGESSGEGSGGAVESVNGQTGVVVLTAADVNAISSNGQVNVTHLADGLMKDEFGNPFYNVAMGSLGRDNGAYNIQMNSVGFYGAGDSPVLIFNGFSAFMFNGQDITDFLTSRGGGGGTGGGTSDLPPGDGLWAKRVTAGVVTWEIINEA